MNESSKITGEFFSPSADRHSNVAPHKSTSVPSCRIFVSANTCEYTQTVLAIHSLLIRFGNFKRKCIYFFGNSISMRGNWIERTGSPFCCAERDSRRLNTSPPTEHSRHGVVPGFSVLLPAKSPFGCITNIPFVVKPSIVTSTWSCHFVAFSCKEYLGHGRKHIRK